MSSGFTPTLTLPHQKGEGSRGKFQISLARFFLSQIERPKEKPHPSDKGMGLLYSYPFSLLWQKGESELYEAIGLPQSAIQQEEIQHKENGFATRGLGLSIYH